jgi:YfiH family protein
VILCQKNGVSFYQFPNLAGLAGIFHGIFSRNSGHSKSPYESLNVSHSVGDDSQCVQRNREIISEISGSLKLVFINQVHGAGVVVFSKKNMEYLQSGLKTAHLGDALVSDITQICLVVKLADCQAVLLVDPEKQVVANIHTGWRGSIHNIIGRTIDAMVRSFGGSPFRFQAAIGPSLGPCCAEFVNYRQEIPQAFWQYKTGLNYFDLWAISFDQLIQAGVLSENIYVSKICTRCHTDQFFSYRGEGVTGRFAAVIALT